MSTKVPLVQPADDNDVMFLDAEAGGRVVVVVAVGVVVGGRVVVVVVVAVGVVVGGRVVAAGAMEV